jgi:predicted alpha-1,2-mannosidase
MTVRKLISTAFVVLGCISCKHTPPQDLIQYVNPLIGSTYSRVLTDRFNAQPVGYGQTIPAVTLPFGMTQWTPQIDPTENRCVAPYYSTFLHHQGIRATHWLNGSCQSDYGSFTFMPVNGTFIHAPSQRRSSYDFNTLESSPAYLSIHLHRYLIQSEVTATKRAGFLRFSWLDPDHPCIIVDINSDQGKGSLHIDPEKNEISGFNPVFRQTNTGEEPAGFSGYFIARFDTPFIKYGVYTGHDYEDGKTEGRNEPNLGGYLFFDLRENQTVQVKVGTSFTSLEKARLNLEAEIPHWNFEQVLTDAEKEWNEILGHILIEGGQEEDKIVFYSALYRSLLQPRLFNDVDGSYMGFDHSGKIVKTENRDYYVDFMARDIFASQMPLVSLLAPRKYEDMIHSLILKAEQGDRLPLSSFKNGYHPDAKGDYVSVLISDALVKGFEVDTGRAWPWMAKNALEPSATQESHSGKGRSLLEPYLTYGYIPVNDEPEADSLQENEVSRTLDYAYNDWCLAQVAKKLNREDEYQNLSIRAENYANVFNPENGWVCGRLSNNYFTQDFREDEEMPWLDTGTPRQNSWFVPHNIPILIERMGGKDLFIEKLETLITSGEYDHGNGPMHFIPYLFNYVDDWEKTQEAVKNILSSAYNPTFGGIPGKDVEGKLASWYVFSAMGFYPVNPVSNTYQLSSPIFSKVTLKLDPKYYPGKKFELSGNAEDPTSIYQEAKLNGKKIGTEITFRDIQEGGRLEFSLSK